MDSGGKQRVIGACVLIAVGVLFLPLLLERSEEQVIDTDSRIPAQPELTLYQHQDPQRPSGSQPPPSEQELFVAPEPATPATSSGSNEPEVAPLSAEQAGVEQTTTKTLDQSGLPKSWVVQVASFTEQPRADKMVASLIERGHRAYARSVSSAGKKMYRVYVGPSIDRDDALQTKTKLDEQLNANTLVLKLTP